MTLLAGAWLDRSPSPALTLVNDMLLAMDRRGEPVSGRFGGVALASSDRVRQAEDGTSLLVLAGPVYRHAPGSEPDGTDARRLLRHWRRRGIEAIGEAIGDFAVLLFDQERERMIAFRSPGSAAPLFVATFSGVALAASRPEALFAHRALPRQLDFRAAGRWVSRCTTMGELSMFEGVRRVLPGQALALRPGETPTEIWRWTPLRRPLPVRTLAEAGEALRHGFDEAVSDRLPPSGELVAAQLSAGRDSSAVTASAAHLLAQRGERMLAVTGAPAEGVPAPAMTGRNSDESEQARATADLLGNVDHQVCRPVPGQFLASMSELHSRCFQPFGNPGNMPWLMATYERSRAAGASVLLLGAAGNTTISTGGRDYLGDVAREDGPVAALGAAIRSGGGELSAWRNMLHVLAGPLLTPDQYRRIMEWRGTFLESDWTIPLLRSPHRQEAERQAHEQWPDLRPKRSGYSWRAEQLRLFDPGEIMHPDLLRIEQRDPTIDRRVVDLMLGMPPSLMLPVPGSPRPLFGAAFGGRLPRPVVVGRVRGYQGADWSSHFPVERLFPAFAELLRHPLNRELFDSDYILDAIPRRTSEPARLVDDDVLDLHRNQILGAFAVADWINVHFPR